MSIRNIVIGALVATSVAAVPVAASAAKARHTAVAKVLAVRKSAAHAGPDSGSGGSGGLGGISGTTLAIGAGALGALGLGIGLAASNHSPASP